MDLITEAKQRGYRKGVGIIYPQPGGFKEVDRIEGDYLELKDGKVVAFAYPKNERNCFDKMRFDTIYTPEDGWVELAK